MILSPSDAALVADVLDETLDAAPGPPSPLHARLMDIRDRLRDSEAGAAVSIPGVRVIEADGMPGNMVAAFHAEMDESLDRATTTMSLIDEATGQGRR